MLADLTKKAEALVLAAQKAGADKADAVIALTHSTAISVRDGKVENTNANEDESLSLRVFVGQRIASVNATTADEPSAIAARAVAMARVSPEDPFAVLIEKQGLAQNWPDLDLLDETVPDAEALQARALATEAAALAIEGVAKSSGASASRGKRGMVLVTSEGFHGAYERSGFSVSTSVIAGSGTAMERDYAYHSATHYADLKDDKIIGEEAGQRAVRRLNAIKPKTGNFPVIFDPRVARGLAGHISSAVNGSMVARKTSFLRNKMGAQILPSNAKVVDYAHKIRGLSSKPFDGDGLSVPQVQIIENGVLQNWLLCQSAGLQLGLASNGRASRSGASVSPSNTNFVLSGGTISPDALMKDIGEGLYITEVFGQGVNLVTGEYSRGASGFMIRNGELAEAIAEFTIASNLEMMFASAILADDCDLDYSTAAPTIAIPFMTVAGA